MSGGILFWSSPAVWEEYREALPRALADAGVPMPVAPDLPLAEAHYLVYAPQGPRVNLHGAHGVKAVLSLWAGVESVIGDVPPEVPLTRMVDPGMTAGMVEYVAGHVLRHHLGMDAYIVNPDHRWRKRTPPLARDRKVTILGMGALGSACASALVALGFAVSGWSRSARHVEGVRAFAGKDGLAAAVHGAEIVVLLLPLTGATEGVVDRSLLARLAPGAVILNPGRGGLVDDAALIEALDTGRVGHATLDAFREEPLPQDHPFWAHPRITVTPHIASATRPETASAVIAENVRRGEAGEPFLHLVDRARGY